MALLWNKLPSIVVRQPIYSLNTYRYVRGGTTITIKATQPRTKESINQELIRYRKVKQSNRGASRTLHAINERYGKLDPELDIDYVDNMSTVVNDVDAELNEQMKAANKDLTAKSLFNIKRKYFKEPKLPNMVPYLEKQDMKILHENDPENWNVDKIAESFPVTPQIAKKILRSPFRAYTVEQVKRHDEAVKRNWKLLKEGKLDIPDELRDHLHKFVDRISFETKDNVIKKYLPSKPNFEIHIKKKEFSSIIDKYEMHKNGSKPNQNKVHIDEDNKIVLEKPEASMSMIDEDTKSNVYHKHVTLDLLRDKIRKQSHKASELSQLILEMENKYQPQPKNEVQTLQENFDHVLDDEVMNKDYENKLTKINDKYPLRIDIPEDKWKPNQLYQVKDCFYNDSGAFLFRVPGLFK